MRGRTQGRARGLCVRKGNVPTIPVYDGHRLRHGNRIVGPALIETVTTAVFISEATTAVDRYGSFVLYRKGREDLVRDCLGAEAMAHKIDPILLSVYARTFRSITDEMSISMHKTTRSPILCEAKDFVTGLYDAEGRMLEQTENLPILAFSLAPVCKYICATSATTSIPATSSSTTTCSRSATRTTTSPSTSRCSSRTSWWPGPRSRATRPTSAAPWPAATIPTPVEVWQEALRIPPIKVYEKGKLRKDVWDLIFANIRFDIVQHDMKAEIGACHVGERRVVELLKKYGRENFEAHKGGAVRGHAQDDGGRDRDHPERHLFRRRLGLLRRPPRGLEIHRSA